jgi:hypothetical protein
MGADVSSMRVCRYVYLYIQQILEDFRVAYKGKPRLKSTYREKVYYSPVKENKKRKKCDERVSENILY